MFCNKCGKELDPGARFCNGCGAQVEAAGAPPQAQPGQQTYAPAGQQPGWQPEAPAAPGHTAQSAWPPAPTPGEGYGQPQQPAGGYPQDAASYGTQGQGYASGTGYPAQGQGYGGPAQPYDAQANQPYAQQGQPYDTQATQQPYAQQGQPYDTQAQQPYGQDPYGQVAPAYAAGQVPAQKKGGPKLPLVIGIVALVIVLVVVAVVALPLGSKDPTTVVMNAFGKTFSTMGTEWAQAGKSLGLEGFTDAYADGKTHGSFAVEISGLDDTYDRVGMRAEGWSDIEARKMEGTASLTMAGTGLVDIELGADDNILWAEVPALLQGVYGINTETLVSDLERLDGYYGTYEGLDFNLFDLLETAREAQKAEDRGDGSPVLEAATIVKVAGLWSDLKAAIETTELGKADVSVNGYTKQAQHYEMRVPAEAVETFLQGMADALAGDAAFLALVENGDIYYSGSYYYEPLTPEEQIYDFFEEMADVFSEDIHADIYIDGGCVVRAEFFFESYYGDEVLLTLEFGGQEHLIDGFTLTMAVGAEEIVLAWTGQHIPVDGVFSTSLVVTELWYGEEEVQLDLRLRWDSAADYDNVSFSLDMPESYSETYIEGRGSLVVDGKKGVFDMQMDNVTYQDYWDEYSFAVDYVVEPFASHDFAPKSPRMLLDMSEAELEELLEELQYNLMTLMFSMM